MADGIDQARLFGDRYEQTGQHEPARRVVPPQQRFQRGRPPRDRVHARLVIKLQLVALERIAQLDFDREPVGPGAHCILEQAVLVAALRFRGIHREVSVF